MTYKQIVEAYKGYSEELKIEDNRRDENAQARGAFMVAARTHLNLVETARVVGKHHGTVIHYEKNHESNLKFSPMYRDFWGTACNYIKFSSPSEYSELLRLKMENSTLKNTVRDLERKIKKLELV